MQTFLTIVSTVYNFLWGDLFTIPLPGGGSIGISLLVAILIPAGIYFTIRTKFLPIRLFPEMLRISLERNTGDRKGALSGMQALIVSTATRVGMGNMVGVVAAISAGGAGAVFWMWATALIGCSTAFVEATLAQICNEKDPLYGGLRGGPAYYIHRFFARSRGEALQSGGCTLCPVRPAVLVRRQPGHQQFRFLRLLQRFPDPAHRFHGDSGGPGCGHRTAEKHKR